MGQRRLRFDPVVRYWHSFTHNDQVILSMCALGIGVAVGYGAIGFRLLLAVIQHVLFGTPSEALHSHAATLPAWQLVLAPTAGGFVVGLMLRYLMPDQRPQGVADVIDAGALHRGRMTARQGAAAALVSVTSLGCGASTGREGPLVHLGASAASWLAQRLHLGTSLTLTLLACGVASGVAASFNAPMAGVFFALEVVLGHYALHAFAPIVISSVAGTIICRIHLGDFPAFIIPEYAIQSFLEFPAFVLLGLVSAITAMLFMWSATFAEDTVSRLPIRPWLRPTLGGLAVGIIAIAFPQVLGVGYEATDAALKEQFSLTMLFALIVAKTTATAISLGCRFGGGVFSPSLFVGAMTGGAFGLVAAAVFPELAASQGLYAIVGMGAVAGAVLGAPISTILIVFELTGDYKVTMAVMVAVVVASVIVHNFLGRSFFTWQLARRGISIEGGRARYLLHEMHVRDIMSDEFAVVPAGTGAAEIRRILREAPYEDFFVEDDAGRLVGSISFADLRQLAFDEELDNLVNAQDLARRNTVVLEADQCLDEVLRQMDSARENHVPVVDNRDSMAVIGVVFHRHVLAAHNRALQQAHAEEHGESIG